MILTCPLCGQEVPEEGLSEHIQKFDSGIWFDRATGSVHIRARDGYWFRRILSPRALGKLSRADEFLQGKKAQKDDEDFTGLK